jgi:hypothetical protein
MIKTFTLVRMRPGLSRDEFFDRWCAHTRDFDLRDHPEITLNRLTLFEEGVEAHNGGFVGLAENHWPDRESIDAAIRWYQTPPGIAHNQDLEAFMDIANSPTSIVDYEVEVSEQAGISWKSDPERG